MPSEAEVARGKAHEAYFQQRPVRAFRDASRALRLAPAEADLYALRHALSPPPSRCASETKWHLCAALSCVKFPGLPFFGNDKRLKALICWKLKENLVNA